jgi:hypothetical protein
MNTQSSSVESTQDSASISSRVFHVLLDLSEARITTEEATRVYLARCLGYMKHGRDSFTWQTLSENVFLIEITASRDYDYDARHYTQELAQELGAYLVCHPACNFSHEGIIRDCYIKVYEAGSSEFWGTLGCLENGNTEFTFLLEKLGREVLGI